MRQPEDVAVFGRLKTLYAKKKMSVFTELMMDPKTKTLSLGYNDFNRCFREPWEAALSKEVIERGYAQTGFSPCTAKVYWDQLREAKEKDSTGHRNADSDNRMPMALERVFDAIIARVAVKSRGPQAEHDDIREPESDDDSDSDPGDAAEDVDDETAPRRGNAARAAPGHEPPKKIRATHQMWTIMDGINCPEAIAMGEDIKRKQQAALLASTARKEARATAATAKKTEATALATSVTRNLLAGTVGIPGLKKPELCALLTSLGAPVQNSNTVPKEKLVALARAAWANKPLAAAQ